MEEKVKEAIELLKKNGYVVRKFTECMEIDANECEQTDCKECVSCSCCICMAE